MAQINSEVEIFFNTANQWQEEMKKLRTISLDCGLTEKLKWGKPCYTLQNSNIVIIQPFKDFCALMFFKGAVLNDPKNVLEKPGPNSRVSRRVPFTSVQEIDELESILKDYIYEAIEAEKAGLEVDLEDAPVLEYPEEFQTKMEKNPQLKTAFKALTPGRQREYLFYFSGAKQSKTRKRRIEKYIPHIIEGKGFKE